MTITPDLLARWKDLAAKATAGPWDDDQGGVQRPDKDELLEWDGDGPCSMNQDDAAFIAEARTAVPALIAEVESLQREYEQLAPLLGKAITLSEENGRLATEVERLRAELANAQRVIEEHMPPLCHARAAAIEECAKLAESIEQDWDNGADLGISTAIRALK